MNFRQILSATIALPLFACGSVTANAPAAPMTGPAATSHADMGAPSRNASPSPASQVPIERPGLGTQWGETRVSHVQDVAFTRADSSYPTGAVSLRYNDSEGITALAQAKRTSAEPADAEVRVLDGVTVSVRNEWGGAFDARTIRGNRYVIGNAGSRYVIRVNNRTSRRFEIVATVDGLDVLSGKSGSFDRRGYLVDAQSSLDIDGFRQSDSQVAAFRFGKVAESYATQTVGSQNVGVIGVAAFVEKSRPSDAELQAREGADPFPSHNPRYAAPPPR